MSELPLRERKYAATKAALTRAVAVRLKQQSLEEIAVKEICAEAQVSEATFFNYFPTKAAVVGYRVQLWSIEARWRSVWRPAAPTSKRCGCCSIRRRGARRPRPGSCAKC
ncbi:MAG TPA: TetR family transcriptional regulator [Anaerolineales bacterium]|nr:TetR family transcriptional regulator [Anaerolineales bacterium]